MKRLAAVLAAATSMLIAAAPARAATALLRDVDGGAQVQLVDRGACASADACAWPAPDADWGPPLEARAGDTLEVTLDAPAASVEATVDGGAPAALTAGADARTWRLTVAPGDASRIGLLVHDAAGGGEAFTASLTAPRVVAGPPPGPPPLAFRSATLEPRGRAIAVRLLVTSDLGVTVTVSRAGTRLARGSASLHPGTRIVRVALGPRARARLHRGRHVTITLDYGASKPLRTSNAVLR